MTKAESSDRSSGASSAIIVIFVILVFLFGPLIAALFEYFVFGTQMVEDFMRSIGLHGFYRSLYAPIRFFIELFT